MVSARCIEAEKLREMEESVDQAEVDKHFSEYMTPLTPERRAEVLDLLRSARLRLRREIGDER